MKKWLLVCFVIMSLATAAQSKDEMQIRDLLNNQTKAWNRGDVGAFMQGYWHSDSLLFIGKSGVNKGWETTLQNYKRGYPDTTAMGKLDFDILQVKKLSPDYYFVIGKWHLQRTIGDLSGHYTLLFKKIKQQWFIIADHSS